MPSIFELLERMRERTELYIGDPSCGDPLARLQDMLMGYQMALQIHGIEEHPPRFVLAISTFIHERTGWPTLNLGPMAAIKEHTETPEEGLAMFFDFVDEFRKTLAEPDDE